MIKAPRSCTKKSDQEFYAPVPVSSALGPSSAARLLDAFLAGRKEETIKAYRADLEDFQAFVQASSLDQAAGLLMARGLGEANALALAYRTHLMERELAAITINRRLTALRSMIKLARTLGLIPWTLEIQGLKTEGYRDTRGPGRNGFRALLEVLGSRADAKTLRDRAILRCLFDLRVTPQRSHNFGSGRFRSASRKISRPWKRTEGKKQVDPSSANRAGA